MVDVEISFHPLGSALSIFPRGLLPYLEKGKYSSNQIGINLQSSGKYSTCTSSFSERNCFSG